MKGKSCRISQRLFLNRDDVPRKINNVFRPHDVRNDHLHCHMWAKQHSGGLHNPLFQNILMKSFRCVASHCDDYKTKVRLYTTIEERHSSRDNKSKMQAAVDPKLS